MERLFAQAQWWPRREQTQRVLGGRETTWLWTVKRSAMVGLSFMTRALTLGCHLNVYILGSLFFFRKDASIVSG